MRLINCITKEIEEFLVDIPRYAILSHTWDEEELTFAEMVRDREMLMSDHSLLSRKTVKKKKGWHKIDWVCNQTISEFKDDTNKVEHVWVDTVCIDKTSSAELSEAINSMFKWYKEAVVCFVFLSDVPQVLFKQSRWFTRGWTLQELIAPRIVKFYRANGTYVDEKSDILSDLEDITGINASAMAGARMRLFSVACIMSWAARRKTTRIEDQAYSLLGLFGLNMPLLYGEGNKAFHRLQLALFENRDDQSIFAWADPPRGSFYTGVFAPDPSHFQRAKFITPLTDSALKCRPPKLTRRGVKFYSRLELDWGLAKVTVVLLNCHDASKIDASKPPSLIAILTEVPYFSNQDMFARLDFRKYIHTFSGAAIKRSSEYEGVLFCYEPDSGLISVHVKTQLPELIPATLETTSFEPTTPERAPIVRYKPSWPEGHMYHLDEETMRQLCYIWDANPSYYMTRLVYRRDDQVQELTAGGDVDAFLVIYKSGYRHIVWIAVLAFSSLEALIDFDETSIPESKRSSTLIDYKRNGLHLSVRLKREGFWKAPNLDIFSSTYSGPACYTRGKDFPFGFFQ